MAAVSYRPLLLLAVVSSFEADGAPYSSQACPALPDFLSGPQFPSYITFNTSVPYNLRYKQNKILPRLQNCLCSCSQLVHSHKELTRNRVFHVWTPKTFKNDAKSKKMLLRSQLLPRLISKILCRLESLRYALATKLKSAPDNPKSNGEIPVNGDKRLWPAWRA